MPFSSQFALSLELTRLVPVSLTAASTAAEALMKLARNLQVLGLYPYINDTLMRLFYRRIRVRTS
jgi:hypothetical protein